MLPQKHVRFAYRNTFHSAAPQVTRPPFTSSNSTVSSSMGSAPRPIYGISVCSTPRQFRLHPYLERSAISWDLMDHPSTITRYHSSISSRTLCEPATNPPQVFMTIILPQQPWIVKAHASYNPCVTLEDVFYAIYNHLRTNITVSEFNELATPNDRWRAKRAYEQRYRRQQTTIAYEAEKRGGMKCVDLFMGQSRFLGVSSAFDRPDGHSTQPFLLHSF